MSSYVEHAAARLAAVSGSLNPKNVQNLLYDNPKKFWDDVSKNLAIGRGVKIDGSLLYQAFSGDEGDYSEVPQVIAVLKKVLGAKGYSYYVDSGYMMYAFLYAIGASSITRMGSVDLTRTFETSSAAKVQRNSLPKRKRPTVTASGTTTTEIIGILKNRYTDKDVKSLGIRVGRVMDIPVLTLKAKSLEHFISVIKARMEEYFDAHEDDYRDMTDDLKDELLKGAVKSSYMDTSAPKNSVDGKWERILKLVKEEAGAGHGMLHKLCIRIARVAGIPMSKVPDVDAEGMVEFFKDELADSNPDLDDYLEVSNEIIDELMK